MDKKWWETEAKRCEARGYHEMAAACQRVGDDVKETLTIEQRAQKRLAEVERRIRRDFIGRECKRLHITSKGK